MSDVTPPSGDLPPPPPGPPGPGFWQQSSTPLHEPAPERPPTYVTPPGLQQPLGTASGPTAPELAGFWRRAWARGITLLFWLLVLDVGTYLITLLFLFINSATPNDSILLAGLAASWAYGLLVTYLIWSRSLATRRGTLGMRQMGLSIRRASRNPAISKGQAFRRSFIALLPLVVASGSGWLLLYSPDDNLIVLSLIVQAALVGLEVPTARAQRARKTEPGRDLHGRHGMDLSAAVKAGRRSDDGGRRSAAAAAVRQRGHHPGVLAAGQAQPGGKAVARHWLWQAQA